MTYFRPHFMMAPGNDPQVRDHTANSLWLNYDQALNLQSTQQNSINLQVQREVQVQRDLSQHKPIPIKHEQVDQARYGFDQINYSGASQPSSLKVNASVQPQPKPPQPVVAQKTEVVEAPPIKYNCDQCDYQATQKSSLNRHKMTQHEGIKQPSMAQLNGKTFDCDLCAYQATQLSSLKRHKMAKHSGSQFRCDLCEYIGTTEINLRLHKRSKHEGVRFPCDMCGYEATQPCVLNRHKQQKHGMQPVSQQNRQNSGAVVAKPPKDPNAPKRPLSGFFHFSNIGRAKVKAANPDFTVADISKELSRRWHALDEITRDMFEQMADSDKDRFRQEKAEYQMSPKGGYKQTRAKKDPNAPKRPLCGFMYFSNEERPKVRLENPGWGVGEMGKELGRRWAEADPEVRQKYNEMANADKERFLVEKNEFMCSPRSWKGKRAKKNPNAPKRNVHGFMWFSHEERVKIRDQYPGMRVGDVAKELSRRWAMADPDTKAKYDQMAYHDKQRYEKEKHEWHMKQRQTEMEAPRPMIRMEGPGYTVTPKWGEQSHNQQQSAPQSIAHQTASPPTYMNATSPPIAINHHYTPPPTVRYGY